MREDLKVLGAKLDIIASTEAVETWFGKLGTDRGKVCMACGGSVWLTFPKDSDGELVTPATSPFST